MSRVTHSASPCHPLSLLHGGTSGRHAAPQSKLRGPQYSLRSSQISSGGRARRGAPHTHARQAAVPRGKRLPMCRCACAVFGPEGIAESPKPPGVGHFICFLTPLHHLSSVTLIQVRCLLNPPSPTGMLWGQNAVCGNPHWGPGKIQHQEAYCYCYASRSCQIQSMPFSFFVSQGTPSCLTLERRKLMGVSPSQGKPQLI